MKNKLECDQHSHALAGQLCRYKKHRNRYWNDVVAEDPEYARWAAGNIENLPEDVRAALLYFTNE